MLFSETSTYLNVCLNVLVWLLKRNVCCCAEVSLVCSAGVIQCLPLKVDFASIDAFNELPRDLGKTWSLSENEIRTNNQTVLCSDYPLNLDNLAQGQRVGLMVKENGALHFYLDGRDMSCAAKDIPKGVRLTESDVMLKCMQTGTWHSSNAQLVQTTVLPLLAVTVTFLILTCDLVHSPVYNVLCASNKLCGCYSGCEHVSFHVRRHFP